MIIEINRKKIAIIFEKESNAENIFKIIIIIIISGIQSNKLTYN